MTERPTVVIATRNRRNVLLHTLRQLQSLPERPRIIVVDNASSDGTPRAVRAGFPDVDVLRMSFNAGAAARNAGVMHAGASWVAFCDDDCWWAPGSLSTAAQLLRRYPDVAVLNARVIVGDACRLDPACAAMSHATDDGEGPGKPILYFMAGASVIRTDAFFHCGGYEPRFHIGAEETLLAIDLNRDGWRLRYIEDMVVHHYPAAAARRSEERALYVMRNRVWTAWLRYTLAGAARATAQLAMRALSDPLARHALRDAAGGLSWILRERHPVDSSLQRRIDSLAATR